MANANNHFSLPVCDACNPLPLAGILVYIHMAPLRLKVLNILDDGAADGDESEQAVAVGHEMQTVRNQ